MASVHLQAAMVAWGETMVKEVSDKPAGPYRSHELPASLPVDARTAQEKLLHTQETLMRTLGLSSPKDFAFRSKNFSS